MLSKFIREQVVANSRYWFPVVLTFSLCYLYVTTFSVARAVPCLPSCFEGWITNSPSTNYGAKARIGQFAPQYYTSGPNGVGILASFNGVLSLSGYDNPSGLTAFIQTGQASYINSERCGTGVKVVAEYLSYAGTELRIISRCYMQVPTDGQPHFYDQQYDENNGRWFHDFDGIPIQNETAFGSGEPEFPSTGFDSATQTAVYGEARDTRIELGGPNPTRKLIIDEIQYKSAPTGGFNYYTEPPINPVPYADFYCGAIICPPYFSDHGGASGTNIWFIELWTNQSTAPRIVVTETDDDASGTIPGTLSFALANAQDGEPIVFDLPSNSRTINVTGSLIIPDGTVIDGGNCLGFVLPPITIIGFGAIEGDGVTVQGRARIHGLRIRDFPGRQLVVTDDLAKVQLTCVVTISRRPQPRP